MQIDGDEDAQGLVAGGFLKILYGDFWDEDIQNKAKEIARWLTDNTYTEQEKMVVRDAGLSRRE